jgi:hypothetical protein
MFKLQFSPVRAVGDCSHSCSLTQQELQKYPGSLLSNIAASCSSDSNNSNISITTSCCCADDDTTMRINLDEALLTFLKPSEAAVVIPALYRYVWPPLSSILLITVHTSAIPWPRGLLSFVPLC